MCIHPKDYMLEKSKDSINMTLKNISILLVKQQKVSNRNKKHRSINQQPVQNTWFQVLSRFKIPN